MDSEQMKQLSLWDDTQPDADVIPVPLGTFGQPVYYTPSGFILKEPRKLICAHCQKSWHTLRPDVTEWQCHPETCFFGNPASFDTTLLEQIEDEDNDETE